MPLKAQGPATKANTHRTCSHSGGVRNPWQSRLQALPALLACLWLLFVKPADPPYKELSGELGPDQTKKTQPQPVLCWCWCVSAAIQTRTEPAGRGHGFPVKALGNTRGKKDAPPAPLLGKMSINVCILLRLKNCEQKPQICRKDSLHESILRLCFGHL